MVNCLIAVFIFLAFLPHESFSQTTAPTITSTTDDANLIFAGSCEVIASQAARQVIIDIANNYQQLLKINDPNCNPKSLAPNLSESLAGSVCLSIEDRNKYDFCKGSFTVADTTNISATADDQPKAAGIAILKMLSITEQMVRNDCFKKIINKDENLANNIANVLGVIQNYTSAASSFSPILASVTIGSRLAMILSGAIGAIVDVVDNYNKTIAPTMFAGKVCGLENYMMNRVKADCVQNCVGILERSKEIFVGQMCLLKPFDQEMNELTGNFKQYMDVASALKSVPVNNSQQEFSTDADNLSDSMVALIYGDRQSLSSAFGVADVNQFTDSYFDIQDKNDPRLDILDYELPSTILASQKKELSLIYGIPGLIFKEKFCDDPAKAALNNDTFKVALNFKAEEVEAFCKKMDLYWRCGKAQDWRANSMRDCQEERKLLSKKDYRIFADAGGSRIFELMNALQTQKLTQEIKSSNSRCFSEADCRQNKYDCMATLNTFDGGQTCSGLSALNANARNVKYMKSLQEGKYIDFHRNIIEADKNRIAQSVEYKKFMNLSYASSELGELYEIATTKKNYDECMEGKFEVDRDQFCKEQHLAMQDASFKAIDRCMFKVPNPDGTPPKLYTSWDGFFKSTERDGNFVATIERAITSPTDPWATKEQKETKTENENTLSLSVCQSLYCLGQKLDKDYNPGVLANAKTWFGVDNDEFLKSSLQMREMVGIKCPILFEQKKAQIQSTTNWGPRKKEEMLSKIDKYKQCNQVQCGGKEGIISQLDNHFNSADGSWLDLSLDACAKMK